jgi:hypothetical protein
MTRSYRRLAGAAVAAAILGSMVSSNNPARADEIAGPSVARISLSDGDVAVQRGDADDLVSASINAPLLSGDTLSTGDGSRAEIQLDGRSMVRIAQDAEVQIVNLDPAHREMELAGGTIDERTFAGAAGPSIVDTPSISVRSDGPASVRITVSDAGVTQVNVRVGHASVLTAQDSIGLQPGTTLVASGPPASPTISYAATLTADDFDQFCQSRDDAVLATLNLPYVNPAIGYADFTLYGRWVVDPTYGEVWVPGVTIAGWAPYRYGRWAWEEGYGWCWVADEPWGWAPYHYGRWFYSGQYGWAWYPPAVAARPLWSPALVGFVTFGGVSIGVGFGSIGWVPLAPYEVYRPWYGWSGGRFGPTVVNNVTVTNVSITRVYQNAGRSNAITAVSTQNFVAGSFGQQQPVPLSQLSNAQAVRGTLPVTPSRASLAFGQRPVSAQLASRATSAFAGRPFAGNTTASITRTPFAQQRSALKARFGGGNASPGYQAPAAAPNSAPQSSGATPRPARHPAYKHPRPKPTPRDNRQQ